MLCTWIWQQGVDKQEKMDYYQNAYDAAQVNDLKEYMGQTLGNIIDQMEYRCDRWNRHCVYHCRIDYGFILENAYYQRICRKLPSCEA